MSQIQVTDKGTVIEPEAEATYIFVNDTAKVETSSNIEVPSNPVTVLDNVVRISRELISPEKYYPFTYKGKKFLLFKPSKGVTEIYKVND